MSRPCLVYEDVLSRRFTEIDGVPIEDFASLPELAVALIRYETDYALKTLTENYQEVESMEPDDGWAKFRSMSSRDAVDYLVDLLLEVVDTFDSLFKENSEYKTSSRPQIVEILNQFDERVQTIDNQYGIRYSKEDYCPVWLYNASSRHLSHAIKYTMKWPDGGSIEVITGKSYPSQNRDFDYEPASLQVKVQNLDRIHSNESYEQAIIAELDYRKNGRSLAPFYDPPVLESFTNALRAWFKANNSFGAEFWQQQVGFYEKVFLLVLEELRAAEANLRVAETTPLLTERYGKAKLDYCIARLKAEVLLESYVSFFKQVEHYTHGIISRYNYYPRCIANGTILYYDEFNLSRHSDAPGTPYDDMSFCEYLTELDNYVLFSKAKRPNASILYDVCFGFPADHSGLQLIMPVNQRGFRYKFYDWPEYEDNTVYASEHIDLYNYIFVSEFSPYMAKDDLPAGLQKELDKFKNFHL